MKKFCLVFFLLLIFIFSFAPVKAQYDPLYNQYNFDQLMLNPAYAGVHDILTTSLLYRAQWAGFEGAPQTATLTGHTSLGNNKAGVGATIISERYGVNNNTEVYGAFSYKINFGRSTLSAGISGGYLNYSYNYGDLNLDVQDDPVFNPLNETVSQPNFGFGLWYFTDDYYLGISVPRILQVDVDTDGGDPSSRYSRHYYVSAGGMITLNPTLKIKPYTLVRLVDGIPGSIDIGANLLIRELIWAGILFRDFGAIALMGQMEINDQLRLGYSLELATNEITTQSAGTHEIMLTFDLAVFSQQVLKRRYF
jgi:type IX secretion system PorP/SprF family membrane protein